MEDSDCESDLPSTFASGASWARRRAEGERQARSGGTPAQLVAESSRRFFGDDAQLTCRAQFSLAILRSDQGRKDEAARLFRQILAIQRRTIGAEHLDTVKSLRMLGRTLVQLQKFDEGERCLREPLTSSRRRFGDEHDENQARRAADPDGGHAATRKMWRDRLANRK